MSRLVPPSDLRRLVENARLSRERSRAARAADCRDAWRLLRNSARRRGLAVERSSAAETRSAAGSPRSTRSGGDRGGGVLVELEQVVGGVDQPPLRPAGRSAAA